MSQEEQKLNLLEGWYTSDELDQTYGKGQWRGIPRYAVWQPGSGKWRLIDNGRAGQHNSTYEARETIHTTCTTAGVAGAVCFRKYTGRPLRGRDAIVVSTQDMWKAYRQVPCHQRHIQFLLIMIWHPALGKWVFGKAMGLLFGLAGSVLAFNRIPTFAVAIARRWLAIPVQAFFDDFRILDVERGNGSANRFFGLLMKELGWKLDSRKAQGPTPKAKFLGNVEDYRPKGEPEEMLIEPKPGRAGEIVESIQQILQSRKMTSGEAKTIRGRLMHLASTTAGRMGKGVLHHINQRADGLNQEWSLELQLNLEFVTQLLQMLAPRRINLHRQAAVGPRVWSDASYSVDEKGVRHCKVCAIIAPPRPGKPEGIVLEIPTRILDSFKERKQQIHMGELLGPFCAILQWPELLRNSSAIFFMDNMRVLCNLVNGSSRELDAGTLSFAMHLRLAALNTSCWWEWVASESNCSDGGSREGITCPMAQSLGIPLVARHFPPFPNDFMKMKPKEWETYWGETKLH